MSAKEKQKISNILVIIIVITLLIIAIYIKFISNKEIYATNETRMKANNIQISNAPSIDLEEIIQKNTKQLNSKEEIYEKQEELEYITKYRNNNDLYVGNTQVSQEGKNGIQTITMKRTYDNDGNIISEEQVSCVVTKSSINKIIDIGTKIYVEPEKTKYESNSTNLSFEIALNRPSGLSREQFKKALTDSKDVNKIFQDNYEYFYYIEEQYNINGMFVAALGIHESAWGTSKLAKNKYNLFGYGAYDSNPYNGAYSFSSYSESIDLIARVLVKYYINPSGTSIYDGQVASGKYYNGNTISGVNKKYATDKNWGNGVYKHMQYLYEKISK
jgi:beta-N-acetylglucosaminidase